MTTGFKTGPRTWGVGKQIVEEDGARMCEIWFNLQKADEYQVTLDWFKKNDVQIGLHYWGLIEGEYKANLATHHDDILAGSIKQIKDTVDIGAEIGCVYVNAHPGAERVDLLDLERDTQSESDLERTSTDEAARIFIEVALELHEYATKKGVTLTFETLPGMEALEFKERKGLYDPGNISLTTLKELAEKGAYIGNDVTHTAGYYCKTEEDLDLVWESVQGFSKAIASQTKLIHVNTMTAPFNGTDSHDGVRDEDFERGVFPDREQMNDFLSLFKERDDVFAVPEPAVDMKGNYLALVSLAENLPH